MRIFFTILFLWAIHVDAQITNAYQINKIEVLGGESHINDQVLLKYRVPILNWIARYYQMPTRASTDEELQTYVKTQHFFERAILNEWHLAYVRIEPIIYPESSEIIISINIVENSREWPIASFYDHILGEFPDKDNLINHWLLYETKGTQLAIAGELSDNLQDCQYHHCLFGFAHPKLKKYEVFWSHLTQSQIRDLFIILKFDKREIYRAAAIFILAHVSSCESLYEFISPALLDSSAMVRNNALRVYAMSLRNCHYSQVPWRALSINLNYPSAMLKNKVMVIFNDLYHQGQYKKYIKQNYLQQLIALSHSIQPNLNQFNFYNR